MRRLLSALCILSALFLPGCWDRVEVNDLAIVSMMGLDAAEEGVRLSVSIVIPRLIETGSAADGGSGGVGSAVSIYAANGRSIMDAMMEIQLKVPRRIFWSHASVLVIGDELARQGVRDVMDFWTRHREPRYRIRVAVTPGTAEEFLHVQPRVERLLSESVREILLLDLMPRVTVLDFVLGLRAKGEHPIAPRVVSATSSGETVPKVNGTAIFRDDKLIGYLNSTDTRGLMWLRDEINTGVVTFEIPGGGYLSATLIRATTRVSARMVGGELRILVDIDTEDDIYESSALIDFDQEGTLTLLRQMLASEIHKRIEPALAKVQREFQVDVLGFGDAVRRSLPLLWEGGLKDQWEERFPEVPVDVHVRAHVRRTGEHGIPLGATKEEVRAKQKEFVEQGDE